MGQSKGCGIRSLCGFNHWGGVGFAFAEISMLLNMRTNVDLLELDLDLWIMFLFLGSLRITTWWIFLCTVVSLPGSKGMASR
jgi:hypothetical protein